MSSSVLLEAKANHTLNQLSEGRSLVEKVLPEILLNPNALNRNPGPNPEPKPKP